MKEITYNGNQKSIDTEKTMNSLSSVPPLPEEKVDQEKVHRVFKKTTSLLAFN